MYNFYRDEIDDSSIENNDNGNNINKNKTIASKCFEYKTKITGRTPKGNDTLDTEVAVVAIKYSSNLWKFFDFQLINCEIELYLSSSIQFIIS